MLSLRYAFVLALPVAAKAQLMDRCGDCWCAPGDDGTCPTDTTGIRDSFDNEKEGVLSSFVLMNSPSFLQLQASDGTACYPFADTLGVLANNPQTSLPACVFPDETDTSVCAYKYNLNDTTTCVDREYEILTYDSEEDALADNAAVTHTGGCGVCSSAQDWWVRIRDLGLLESNSVVCATQYFLSGASDRFETLVQCYVDMGFTAPCATLWAHYGAANSVECSGVCIPDSTGMTKLNEDPPTCEYASCLQCSQGFQTDFDRLAGRTLYNSGVTERIIRPCNIFSRIEHDHCAGTSDVGTVPETPPPTEAPAPANDSSDGGFQKFTNLACQIMFLLSSFSLFM